MKLTLGDDVDMVTLSLVECIYDEDFGVKDDLFWGLRNNIYERIENSLVDGVWQNLRVSLREACDET